MRNRTVWRTFVFCWLGALLSFSAAGGVRPVDTDPNFVEAYLLDIGPGRELYSCSGHSALRMKCASKGLDYIFSYEGEQVSDRILTFLAGGLKMGLAVWPAEQILSLYRKDRRGVVQYRLDLPIDVKCRLWKVLDDRVAEGMDLPYDYIDRGCAQTILRFVTDAVKPQKLVVDEWPEKFSRTRRELFCDCLKDYPWSSLFVQSIGGVRADFRLPPHENVVVPKDLLEVLRLAKVAGLPIVSEKGEELVQGAPVVSPSWFTPMVAAVLCLLLVLTGVIGKIRVLQGLILVFYGLLALFYTYLVGFSALPATSWHWLAVPFNPLPVVCWRWRRKWGLWFAVLLLVWIAGILVWPHLLVDSAWLIVAFAYAVFFGAQQARRRRRRERRSSRRTSYQDDIRPVPSRQVTECQPSPRGGLNSRSSLICVISRAEGAFNEATKESRAWCLV